MTKVGAAALHDPARQGLSHDEAIGAGLRPRVGDKAAHAAAFLYRAKSILRVMVCLPCCGDSFLGRSADSVKTYSTRKEC